MTILRRTIAGIALLSAAYVAITIANAHGATLAAARDHSAQVATVD
jgi:hypothetical protein